MLIGMMHALYASGDIMPTQYRIVSPTIALFLEDGRHVAQTVPAGSVITTDAKAFNGNKLINVLWNGKQGMMFEQDLCSRSVKLDGIT
jgi:hypothetical protein